MIIYLGHSTKSNFDSNEQLFSVVVINLDRRTDRWTSIYKELMDKGFPPEIIFRERAVDAQTFDDFPYKLTKGAAALYFSNANVWRKHLNNEYNSEWLLILEDDVEIVEPWNYESIKSHFIDEIKNDSLHFMWANWYNCPRCSHGTEAIFIDKKGISALNDYFWTNIESIMNDYSFTVGSTRLYGLPYDLLMCRKILGKNVHPYLQHYCFHKLPPFRQTDSPSDLRPYLPLNYWSKKHKRKEKVLQYK